MKRHRHCLLMILILCLICQKPSITLAQETRIFDQAGLLTFETITSATETVASLQEAHHMDIVIVTTNDATGKTAQTYADDFYDQHGFGDDGFLFLIDMDNSSVAISACGSASLYLTDERVNQLLDTAVEPLSNGLYDQAVLTFLSNVQTDLNSPPINRQNNTDTSLTFLCIGMIIASILCAIIIYRYKNPPINRSHYDFRANSQVTITQSSDKLIRTSTASQRKHKNTPPPAIHGGIRRHNSNRTTTHRSSSGRRHSGGSRKF